MEKYTLRGRKFTGPIKTSRMAKTAVFEIERRTFIPKYERYEKRRTRIKVHIPEGMIVEDDDIVTIQETRKLSKTKNFLLVENHTKNLKYENGKIVEVKKETKTKKE